MIGRGHWRPLLPPRWRNVTTIVIPLSPIVVGADYLLGEPGPPPPTAIEGAAPIWLWGLLLITAGLTAFAGYLGQWRHVAIVGLHLSGALMLTLGIGVAAETLDTTGGFRLPWLYLAVGIASWAAAIGYAAQVEPDELNREHCGPG